MLRLLFAALVLLAATSTASTVDAQDMKRATAIFAGGCFWCVESDFDAVPGVLETLSGYTGGHTPAPTYKQVSAGGTGHYEAVQITYDPAKVSYEQLLTAYWHSVDPTDDGGQFCDRGHSYETAVFVRNEEERRIAEASKQAAEKALGEKIVTPIKDAGPFFAAEDYHQNFYKKSPVRYKIYRWNCGRNQRVQQVWGNMAYMGIPTH
jgi:peptide-methionine (S)-S-oxide reductase